MTEPEFLELTKKPEIDRAFVLKATDLRDRRPRTLLYGYTCDRQSFHVYLGHDIKIHRLVSDSIQTTIHTTQDDMIDNESYVPNKRLYPESCDYEFCGLLSGRGIYLPFTKYDVEGGLRRLWTHSPFMSNVHYEIKTTDAI